MRVLVFGGSGTIGSEVSSELSARGNEVVTVANTSPNADIQTQKGFGPLLNLKVKFDGCVWAQGINSNDTLNTSNNFEDVLNSNLIYIVNSLKFLLENHLLEASTSLVVVSSVWQNITRKNKFSYTVSKAAIEGLVNSVMADFSSSGMRINAVLPGVVDSKMTRENLTSLQISKIESETPSHTLVTAQELAKVISWLLSGESKGINGQFITVDNGWSNVRTL
jgi:3-oxoacyl-[acyl-carrier protein] reductase